MIELVTLIPGPIPPRPRRGNAPIVMDDTPVKVRGQALDEIWWRGRQWAVTAYGIERLDGNYNIEAGRLTEHIGSGSWMLHMGSKRWIDTEDFSTAWLVAMALHGGANRLSAATVRNAVADGAARRAPHPD